MRIGWTVFSIDDEQELHPCHGLIDVAEILTAYVYFSSKRLYVCLNMVVRTPVNSGDSRVKSWNLSFMGPTWLHRLINRFKKEDYSDEGWGSDPYPTAADIEFKTGGRSC